MNIKDSPLTLFGNLSQRYNNLVYEFKGLTFLMGFNESRFKIDALNAIAIDLISRLLVVPDIDANQTILTQFEKFNEDDLFTIEYSYPEHFRITQYFRLDYPDCPRYFKYEYAIFCKTEQSMSEFCEKYGESYAGYYGLGYERSLQEYGNTFRQQAILGKMAHQMRSLNAEDFFSLNCHPPTTLTRDETIKYLGL